MFFWKQYKKIIRKICVGGAILACVMLAILSVLVTVEVISRSVFGSSTLITDEYSCYLCVGLSFLGAAYAFSSGNFINVDILYAKFPQGVKSGLILFWT